MIARAAASLLLLALVGAADDTDPYRNLQRYDRVLTDVGYRLATRAGDLCPDHRPLTGLAVQDISQYAPGDQAGARRAFGFAGAPLVLAVAAGSPAQQAGVAPDDAILAIDGSPAASAGPGAKSFDRVQAVLDQLDTAAADGTLDLQLRRAGRPVAVHLALESGCATRFQSRTSSAVGASADGRYVSVDTAMMRFADTEDQVAGVVAHELAHNILGHKQRLAAEGVRGGAMFGRGARLIRGTEEEADRLSVYLVDRAGYSTQAIVTFWTRFRQEHGLGILRAPTHMGEKSRIALVQGEIARIAAMKAAGQSPRPAFLEETSNDH